jgi:hypothetical protein
VDARPVRSARKYFIQIHSKWRKGAPLDVRPGGAASIPKAASLFDYFAACSRANSGRT